MEHSIDFVALDQSKPDSKVCPTDGGIVFAMQLPRGKKCRMVELARNDLSLIPKKDLPDMMERLEITSEPCSDCVIRKMLLKKLGDLM